MEGEDYTMYAPEYWSDQLPEYPYPTNGGKPLALEPGIAGKILVRIAQGLHPRAAFASCGISKFTYKRYLQRANTANAGAPNALPISADQDKGDRYLYVFFTLQAMALEAAGAQFAHAQMRLLQGAPTSDFSVKKIKKSRQIITGGRLVTLTDYTETQVERYIKHPPRLPKRFLEEEEFEPGVETIVD